MATDHAVASAAARQQELEALALAALREHSMVGSQFHMNHLSMGNQFHGGQPVLAEFATPADFYCDRCGSDQPEGTTMFGCAGANYDLCADCHAASERGELHPRRQLFLKGPPVSKGRGGNCARSRGFTGQGSRTGHARLADEAGASQRPRGRGCLRQPPVRRRDRSLQPRILGVPGTTRGPGGPRSC